MGKNSKWMKALVWVLIFGSILSVFMTLLYTTILR